MSFKYTLARYGDRFADPMQIRRDLLRASSGHLWQWVAETRKAQEDLKAVLALQPETDEDKDKKIVQEASLTQGIAEMEGTLVQCAYAAFKLTPVNPNDGTGVSESEMAEVLKQFLVFAEGKD